MPSLILGTSRTTFVNSAQHRPPKWAPKFSGQSERWRGFPIPARVLVSKKFGGSLSADIRTSAIVDAARREVVIVTIQHGARQQPFEDE